MKFRHIVAAFLLSLAVVAISPTSLWAQGNFVYTNNNPAGPNTVSALSVGINGALTPIAGSPFLTGGTGDGGGLFAINRIAVNGKLLFVSNGASADVSVFTIDSTSGALSLVAGSPFKTGAPAGGIGLAPTPDSKFLMAASSSSNNTIYVFSVAANGALTLASQVTLPSKVDGVKVSPDGKYLAASEQMLDSVAMFSIAADGSLTSEGTFAGSGLAQHDMADIAINCANNMLYASEYNVTNSIVNAYSIGSGGALTAIAGSPFAGNGIDSAALLLSPDDKTLFVSNPPLGTLAVAGVAANGSLSFLAGSPFAMITPLLPSGMATTGDGSFLFVAEFQNFVSVFNVAANGALTEVPGSPFSNGASGTGLHSLAVFPPKTCAPDAPPLMAVQMMIRPPLTPPVPINPYAEGKLTIAILSSRTFDAPTQVDRGSLTFGATGDEKSLAFCNHEPEDVNGDGIADLVCHFRMPLTGFVMSDTTAYLKGKLVSTEPLAASEAISPRGKKRHHDDDDDKDSHGDGDKDHHHH